VLRLKPRDEVFVFDGEGCEYRCVFQTLNGKRAQLQITEALSEIVESPVRIRLAQAVAKGEKFDFVVQKATELGVSAITPLVTEHTDVRLDHEKTGRRVERWQRIALEAAKQCGRRTLVQIAEPIAVAELFTQPAGSDAGADFALLFNERGGVGIAAALKDKPEAAGVTAIVGPEGGWSDGEIDLLAASGSVSVTLGPRILRTETAAVVAITLIQHALGDLSR